MLALDVLLQRFANTRLISRAIRFEMLQQLRRQTDRDRARSRGSYRSRCFSRGHLYVRVDYLVNTVATPDLAGQQAIIASAWRTVTRFRRSRCNAWFSRRQRPATTPNQPRSSFPRKRIEHIDAERCDIRLVARDERHAVHLCGGGQQAIDGRDVADCGHASPLLRHPMVDLDDAMSVRSVEFDQPFFQRCRAVGAAAFATCTSSRTMPRLFMRDR